MSPVNATRALVALDRLLSGTEYAGYARAATAGPGGRGVADVHNLVAKSHRCIGFGRYRTDTDAHLSISDHPSERDKCQHTIMP